MAKGFGVEANNKQLLLFPPPVYSLLSNKQRGTSLSSIFSKHVVFDKMLETLVKSRASAYPAPRLFPPLFPPVLHDTFCTSGKHNHIVNQVEEKKKKKKSTPTRRAFWQALVRTAKRLESECRSGVEANNKQLLLFSPPFIVF